MTIETTKIPRRQKCVDKNHPYIGGTDDVIDDKRQISQTEVNDNIDTELANRYTKAETYSKTELNNMITTPNQQYVNVTANSQTTDVTDVLPATGAANTVYRVGNWDGSQFDASVYSEYAWNGSQYVHLSTKTQIGEVFDISAYHATGGTLATYADLSAALDSNNGGGIPQSLQKGGMSIKFVQSSDNNYVQFFCTADEFTTDVAQWQGVDEEIKPASKNLAESNAVFEAINEFVQIDITSYTTANAWIAETGGAYIREEASSYIIPINPVTKKTIKVIPQNEKVAVLTFAKTVGNNWWAVCDNITRYVVDTVTTLAIPSDAHYIIVGSTSSTTQEEGYYLPEHLYVSESLDEKFEKINKMLNGRLFAPFSHGNLQFYSQERKITWDETLALYYNGVRYNIAANTEGITFDAARFIIVVWDKDNNTLTTKNTSNWNGEMLIAIITYTAYYNVFERVCFSLLPYTVDGKEYGKNPIQIEASDAVDMIGHIFNVNYNLQSYPSEFGWVNAEGNTRYNNDSLHKTIPVIGGMKLKITGGNNNSYIAFTSSIKYGEWTAINGRIQIDAEQTETITVPSNARYLIVGDRSSANEEEGYYLPSSIQLVIESGNQGAFKCNPRVTGSTNLNDYNEIGWYQLASATIYTNSPVSTAQTSMIINYDYNDNEIYRVQEFHDISNGRVWVRRRNVDGNWSGWKQYTDKGIENNTNYTFTPTSLSSQGENNGIQIKVMSYNIAMYNNDSGNYVSNEKLLNLRKMLNDINPDFIGMQEDRKCIDSANTKTSLAYLFNPVYPHQYSAPMTGDTSELGDYIRSRIPANVHGGLFYSNYATRPKIEYATYTIGSKVLLLISTHLVANAGDGPDSQASIAKRVENLAELFGWVNGTLDLKDIDNNDVHVPTHDWCIITGDMNSITDTDKTNLATAANNANFILGNGGRLGWLQTALRYTGSMTSLDNIIVSNNVIINSFTSYTEWYNRLYSDHVPVMANLTLLDT